MENGERKIRTAVTVVRFVPKLKTVGKSYYNCLFSVLYCLLVIVLTPTMPYPRKHCRLYNFGSSTCIVWVFTVLIVLPPFSFGFFIAVY
jgi:hypothetical protein